MKQLRPFLVLLFNHVYFDVDLLLELDLQCILDLLVIVFQIAIVLKECTTIVLGPFEQCRVIIRGDTAKINMRRIGGTQLWLSELTVEIGR